MRDKLVELVQNAIAKWYQEALEKTTKKSLSVYIADYLLANNMIVPPCNVGDTVYKLDDVICHYDCGHCEHYLDGGFGDPSECGKTRQSSKHPDCIDIVEKQMDYREILFGLAFDKFGKTIFLTKKEAEKVLEDMRKENSSDN